MSFDSLPREVLHGIISHESPSLIALRNYSLVSHNMWEVASAILYRHIDLKIDARYHTEANRKTKQRQLALLRFVSSNPRLGIHVRTFKNYHPWPGAGRREHQDATMCLEDGVPELLAKAAQNMKFLSKASFTSNPLSIQVITNLPSYSQLTTLSITGVKPEEHVWDIAPTSLKKLKWEVASGWDERDRNPWDIANLVIKVAEATCPDLESLEISFCDMYGFRAPALPAVSTDIFSRYQEIQISSTPKLTRLRHFSFKYEDASAEQQAAVEASFLELVTRYSKTLKSVSIPHRYGSMTRETLDFILKVCASLPNLAELILYEKKIGIGQGGRHIGVQFIRELTSTLASPKFEIERLSIGGIEVPFSPNIGKMFASLKSLKFLRVGDRDGSDGPYNHDGRLDFGSYGPEILNFIQELPQSLEELYLEINGQDVWCDEDSDFDPICYFGPYIFGALKRLHTCDIHAWISNVGGGLGQIPEKGVFYRRLPQSAHSSANGRVIWTSRMDCIYQEGNAVVIKDCEELEGDFEGEDADEVWCGGYTFEKPGPTTRGRSPDRPDYSWPGCVNKVNDYPMFQKKS